MYSVTDDSIGVTTERIGYNTMYFTIARSLCFSLSQQNSGKSAKYKCYCQKPNS